MKTTKYALLFAICFAVGFILSRTHILSKETSSEAIESPPPSALTNEDAPPVSYKKTEWDNLIPESWNPEKTIEASGLNQFSDNDARRAEKIIKAIAEEWKNAPVNEQLNGQQIKIAGFVAPLEWENEKELKDFLLVPYFGACIHVPPPPANQIIYIKPEKPIKEIRAMDTIWVYGTIYVEKTDSGNMGVSGYRMKIDKVEPYRE
ncbi:MAG: DUF3299 domain-containing protein [Azoarcus sp.]|jgi:hypothetical protein|nr:DUF3299 domain-containing protein [Azoarcus sp.]